MQLSSNISRPQNSPAAMGLSKYSFAFHLILLTYVCPLSNAQTYPNHIKSTVAPGASIDYKSVHFCCTVIYCLALTLSR
jgi:hypothetical protein